MIEAHGQTDVGRRRKLNEDQFLVDLPTNLFVVCDGMGGHNAGEVASQLAVETLQTFVEKSHAETEITWPYGYDARLSGDANRLKTALMLANRRVYKAADNREDYTGMGTTAVATILSGNVLTVGSAGDSRCYLLRDGSLQQITRDDSWVSVAAAQGILNAQEIEQHPLKNVITKAIGAKESIDIEVSEQRLQNGDVVMLCSDGLHGMVHDDHMLGILHPFPGSLEEAASQLIAAANDAGGRDNVTVVLIRYTE
jgi:serine/threonine protein phosphatase PrpC